MVAALLRADCNRWFRNQLCFQQLLCLLYRAQPWSCTASMPETCTELCSSNKTGWGEWAHTEHVQEVSAPWRCISPAPALCRGWGHTAAQGSDSSLSQCDTSLLVPAESWNLCFGEMKHMLIYWDGRALGHSHTWLCLFHCVSFILWCSPYQKYNNNQRDRLKKQEPLPKVSIKIGLNHLLRSNKQKSLLINFPFCPLFYLI